MRPYYAKHTKSRKARIRAFIRAARTGPCSDCGIELPTDVMELDHVRGQKSFSLHVSKANEYTWDEIRAEVAKCDRRCPNCHKLRHFYEGAWRNGATPTVAETSPRRTDGRETGVR